jgi:hypothetical protein
MISPMNSDWAFGSCVGLAEKMWMSCMTPASALVKAIVKARPAGAAKQIFSKAIPFAVCWSAAPLGSQVAAGVGDEAGVALGVGRGDEVAVGLGLGWPGLRDPTACGAGGRSTAQTDTPTTPAVTTEASATTPIGILREPRAMTTPIARGIPNTTARMTVSESSSASTGLRIPTIGVLLAGVVTAIALGACSPPSGNHTIGAKLAPDGRGIQVVFVPCPGQKVISVELVVTKDAVIGDERDPVLWRIEAPGGVAAGKFVVGQTPSGFTSTVPLRAEPPAGEPLGILLDSSLGQTAVGFTVQQLRPDTVFTDGQSLSPQAFRQQAGGQCGGPS